MLFYLVKFLCIRFTDFANFLVIPWYDRYLDRYFENIVQPCDSEGLNIDALLDKYSLKGGKLEDNSEDKSLR